MIHLKHFRKYFRMAGCVLVYHGSWGEYTFVRLWPRPDADNATYNAFVRDSDGDPHAVIDHWARADLDH